MDKSQMKAVLRLTGLKAETLRAWERRYGAVEPQRSANGRRAYTEEEINRLRLLAELVREGYKIGDIARLPNRTLISRLAHCREALSSSALAEPVNRFLDAVHQFDFKRLRRELARTRFTTAPDEFVFRLIPRLMTEVGEQVARGRMDVSQEHALSDLIRLYLRQTYAELEPAEANGAGQARLVFATPEGHHHDLGLLIVAIACRARGVSTEFLGANLPARSLAQAARELGATSVVLSLADLPAHEQRVPAQTYVEALDQELPGGIGLWAGGRGAPALRRGSVRRDLWIFEDLPSFERKLADLHPVGDSRGSDKLRL